MFNFIENACLHRIAQLRRDKSPLPRERGVYGLFSIRHRESPLLQNAMRAMACSYSTLAQRALIFQRPETFVTGLATIILAGTSGVRPFAKLLQP